MGCDIHVAAERREGERWVYIPDPIRPCWSCVAPPPAGLLAKKKTAPAQSDCYWCEGAGTGQVAWYRGRNYALFARLADVRNSGGRITPICQPRGLPPEMSEEVLREFGDVDGDLHSHTWFTLAELREIDWKAQVIEETTYVDQAGYAKWKENPTELSWEMAAAIRPGSGIELTHTEMESLIESGVTLPRHFTTVGLQSPYGESFGDALRDLYTHCKREFDTPATHVRLIFAFDN